MSAPTAAIVRAWPTGGRAVLDGTPARKQRENYGQRKKERRWKLDVRTTKQNLGRELNELNDEIILEINKLARDLILMDFRDVTLLLGIDSRYRKSSLLSSPHRRVCPWMSLNL